MFSARGRTAPRSNSKASRSPSLARTASSSISSGVRASALVSPGMTLPLPRRGETRPAHRTASGALAGGSGGWWLLDLGAEHHPEPDRERDDQPDQAGHADLGPLLRGHAAR